MARYNTLFNRILALRSNRLWNARARNAPKVSNATLRQYRRDAQKLRPLLDQVTKQAHMRLTPPVSGSDTFQKHPGTDWAWRPDYWEVPTAQIGQCNTEFQTKIADGLAVFHDCPLGQITTRQHRNIHPQDVTPYGIDMDVLGFEGTFLSIAIDFPETLTKNLRKTHVIRMNILREQETPSDIFARLNVKYGPNVEQIVREIPGDWGGDAVEFDLAYTQIMEKRVEKLWLDLIIDRPAMNRLCIRELSFSRHPRAEL